MKKSKLYSVTLTTTVTTKTTTYTPFKILVANQAYSPAAKLSVGGAAYVPAYSYQTAAGLTAASLPSYTLANVGSLAVNLPLTAFLSKDWGTGQIRAGLHPTYYACAASDPKPGPSGETRNGALSIQIVKSTVTDADIQLNVSNGVGVTGKEYDLAPGAHPELGYRLKDASMKNNCWRNTRSSGITRTINAWLTAGGLNLPQRKPAPMPPLPRRQQVRPTPRMAYLL